MTSGQVRTALRENINSLDDADHIGKALIEMQQEQIREAKPEKPYKPVAMKPAEGSWLFRARVRQTSIPLRVYQPNPRYNDDQNRQYKNNWERNSRTVWGPDWKKRLEIDKKLFDERGIERIDFRAMMGAGRQEASFATRDPELAAYIRLRIQEPDLAAIIYEEVGDVWATLDNGERVLVNPANDQSRQTMAAAAAGV